MKSTGAIGFSLLVIFAVLSWVFLISPLNVKMAVPSILELLSKASAPSPKIGHKCGLPTPCSNRHFSFHLKSGVANIIGPKICFEGRIVMSGTKNNIGQGLNIAVVDAVTGKIEDSDFFNMYSGNPQQLLSFLKNIKDGKIILVASFDEPATKMTDEIQDIFSKMGSRHVKSLKFRDGWLFVGASGTDEKSTFEKLIPNDPKTNVYGAWPEMLELGGCFPKKL